MDDGIASGARVMVTGAGGFVGRSVTSALAAAGYEVRPVGRHDIGEIHRGTDWTSVLAGCQAVVHLAARVHDMGPQPEEAYREINLHGTAALVRQANDIGVQRFVFMSTVKVMGESGRDILPSAPPTPHDTYAVSKTEAEAAVRDLSSRMGSAILRPPLVYGPGVQANFERLMRLVASGWPLPFGAVDNRRSLIHVDNLADAVRYALTCEPGTYHPKDSSDHSTPALIRLLAEGMDRPARLIPVPVALLRRIGRLTGCSAEIARLTGDFTSDGSMAGWSAPLASEDSLRATARAFLDNAPV